MNDEQQGHKYKSARDYVRIRYWSQGTEEFGQFVLTLTMRRQDAEGLLEIQVFPRAEIVD